MARKKSAKSKQRTSAKKKPKPIRRPGKLVQQPVGLIPAGLVLPKNYGKVLRELKDRIRSAHLQAAMSINRELIALYRDIGRRLTEQEQTSGWGDKVVEQLALDLSRAFPALRGFSRTNLFYMRQFFLAYRESPQLVQQLVGQIPWGHNITLLSKLKDQREREYYLNETIRHGWSRNVLVHQIESNLYNRKGRAISNFKRTLPGPQSDLAIQTIKDPYLFDFLALGDEVLERDLQRSLTENIRDFLVELGQGFAFVGSNYHLEVGGVDFYLDLLFYHLHLRSYIVIDLKVGEFKPEYGGKMNFYLSAIDDEMRHPDDQPTIGLILCKTQNRVIAEYALRDLNKPVGIASYKLTHQLPQELKLSLPAIKDLEAQLSRENDRKRKTSRKRPPAASPKKGKHVSL